MNKLLVGEFGGGGHGKGREGNFRGSRRGTRNEVEEEDGMSLSFFMRLSIQTSGCNL